MPLRPVILQVGTAEGCPGGEVAVPVTLRDGGNSVAGVELEIEIVSAKHNRGPVFLSLDENPAINKWVQSTLRPTGSTPGIDAFRAKAIVINFENLKPIPDGSKLFTCRFQIPEDCTPGLYPLESSLEGASDPDGNSLETHGENGSLRILPLSKTESQPLPSEPAAPHGFDSASKEPPIYNAFLSYAHDDTVLTSQFVDTFYRYFQSMLAAELRNRFLSISPHEVSIFIDQTGLPANGDLSAELSTAVKASAFLVIFIGRSYPNSNWCSKELAIFIERFAGDRRRALEHTFVIVLDKRVLAANWGEYLEKPYRPIFEPFFDDVTGHHLTAVLEDRGQAVPSPRFSDKLRRIVETMAARMENIR